MKQIKFFSGQSCEHIEKSFNIWMESNPGKVDEVQHTVVLGPDGTSSFHWLKIYYDKHVDSKPDPNSLFNRHRRRIARLEHQLSELINTAMGAGVDPTFIYDCQRVLHDKVQEEQL